MNSEAQEQHDVDSRFSRFSAEILARAGRSGNVAPCWTLVSSHKKHRNPLSANLREDSAAEKQRLISILDVIVTLQVPRPSKIDRPVTTRRFSLALPFAACDKRITKESDCVRSRNAPIFRLGLV